MTTKILYESGHPDITITHNTETGDIIFDRSDKYMRNPGGKPPFIPERIVLINTKEIIK